MDLEVSSCPSRLGDGELHLGSRKCEHPEDPLFGTF